MDASRNKIHITQCHCSHHHCIAAAVWEEPYRTPESMIATLKESITTAIDDGLMNPWCGVCHDDEFVYSDEVVASDFEDAMRHALEMHAESFKAKQTLDILRN